MLANSVTSMSNKRPLSPDEIRMAERMKSIIAKDPNLTEESVGVQMGVTQGQISHWTGGRLPVPAKRALKLATILGIDDPSEISLAYRELAGRMSSGEAQEVEVEPDLAIARLQNDVHSLRIVLSVMATVMLSHRPAEGAAVARALKKHVPAKFARQGFVAELLQTLERAESAGAAESAPQHATR